MVSSEGSTAAGGAASKVGRRPCSSQCGLPTVLLEYPHNMAAGLDPTPKHVVLNKARGKLNACFNLTQKLLSIPQNPVVDTVSLNQLQWDYMWTQIPEGGVH